MEVFSVNQILRELSKNSQLALLLLITTTNCSGYNKGSSGKRCSFASCKGGNLRTPTESPSGLQSPAVGKPSCSAVSPLCVYRLLAAIHSKNYLFGTNTM